MALFAADSVLLGGLKIGRAFRESVIVALHRVLVEHLWAGSERHLAVLFGQEKVWITLALLRRLVDRRSMSVCSVVYLHSLTEGIVLKK